MHSQRIREHAAALEQQASNERWMEVADSVAKIAAAADMIVHRLHAVDPERASSLAKALVERLDHSRKLHRVVTKPEKQQENQPQTAVQDNRAPEGQIS